MNLFRNFLRAFSANKRSYIINMLSLIPGLACCLLILLWILFETGTDHCFPKLDRIATVSGYHEGLNVFRGAPPAVAPTLKQELPEVQAATRVCYAFEEIKYNQQKYDIVSQDVDADIFGMFDLHFVEGVPFTEGEVDKCVLTNRIARGIFGSKSPVGEFLEFGDQKFVVCGIIQDLPKNNTLDVGVFLPILRHGDNLDMWYNNSFVTYVLLSDAGKVGEFSTKIKDRAMKAEPQNKLYLTSVPLQDRYMVTYGNGKTVRLMGIITFFILIIACINFVNLATAGFTRSSFQTGIRKVIGATRRGLIATNLANTFLLIVVSFGIAFLLAIAMLPWFNSMIGRSTFVVEDLFSPMVVWVSLGIVLVTTILAGVYPAFYVASFNPVTVLKGRHGLGGKTAWFRNGLVVLQFAIAITLIICTTIIAKQVRMYQQMDLGYSREEVVYVNLKDELQKKASVLKAELLKNPKVKAASISQNTPARINWNGTGWSWEGMPDGDVPLITFGLVDEDWANVLGVKFKEGHFFEKNSTDIIINQKLAEMMGGTSWVDRYISRGDNLKIVGVLDNFQYNNFKAEAEPLIIIPLTDDMIGQAGCIMVRAEGKNLTEIYDMLKNKAQELNGGEDVEVFFLDDQLENRLYAEKQSARMVSFFSVLAIVISCLGLFGLATFVMEQKRKEIGIRRVNGAKIGEIVWLLNVNFLKPVIIGFAIACPVAYYFMSGWLESYLQRTELSWWVFALAGLLTALVAVITLVWRSLKAAMENPVNSLKSE